MQDLQLITLISVGVIVGAFLWMCVNAYRLLRCASLFKKVSSEEDPLEALTAEKLATAKTRLLQGREIDYRGSKKTNVPSEEYFSEFSVCKAYGINMRLIEAGSGTLVGMGLLGTFLGLTLGIRGFDSSNSENIQLSIQSLLDGMGTAFITSLVGMGLSILYTFWEKYSRNNLAKRLNDFNGRVNDLYYIDDTELISYTQEQTANSLFERMAGLLHYSSAEGQEVPIANAVREILINNQEQTKALKSFSSDLALELNEGFDEVLSRQMQERILPLMESVDATTRSVIEHIDRITADLQSPATDMIERVVEELKTCITDMANEFKTTLSSQATNELENLATTLSQATVTIGEFPQNMAHISEALQLTISEVKNAISDISNSSATASSSAMKQMQEQILFATSAISSAITEVKDVMAGITQSSRQTSTELVEKMAKSAEDMSSFMQTTMERVSEALQTSIQSISNDIADKQTTLLGIQEDIAQSSRQTSTELVEKMAKSAEDISSFMQTTMERVSEALQTSIQSISNDIADKQTTLLGMQEDIAQSSRQTTTELVEKMAKSTEEMSNFMQRTMESVSGSLQQSMQSISNDIADKQTTLLSMQEDMAQTSRQTSAELVEKMAKSVEDMSKFMQTSMENVSGSIQKSMQSISDDIADKQTTLLSMQEETTAKTEKLINAFNISVERLNSTNAAVNGTMDLFQQAQASITGTTAHLQTITADMRGATELFRKGQAEYAQGLEKLQQETSAKMDEIISVFETAGTATGEYAEKFEVVRQGLTQIFSQIQTGLKDYSTTVGKSIQQYLDVYTRNLTDTTNNLASAISSTGELAEMLAESVSRNKK